MKRFFLFLSFVVFSVAALLAQTPQKMTYQAVVRNSGNVLITNHNVSVRISILQGSESGTPVYVENHSTTTNANGLMTVVIGGGNAVSGSFEHINWANSPYFLKSEIDPDGGISYSITSVQQLLSVPYALFAQEAANGFTGDYNDLSNIPNFAPVATSGDYNDLTNRPTFTESQILTISNDTIYLTGGSFVKLPAGFDGNYNSLTNKPNLAPVATSGNYNDLTNKPTLFDGNYNNLTNKPNLAPVATSGNYNDLTNRPQIPQIPQNVSAFNNDAGYITQAAVPTNVSQLQNDAGYITSFTEQQVLTISHDTIYLTGGSFVKLPTAEGFSGSYNDLTDKPTIPTVPTNVSAFTNDAGYLTSFSESQILTISNDTIYLTGGSFVKLPAAEGFSGSYNDLTDKPANVSVFNNDAGYITMDSIPAIPTIPTNVSAFNNDAGYITMDSIPSIPTVPTNVSAFQNDAGYLTSFTEQQVLTISNDTIYLTGGSFVKLPTAEGFSGSYNDLTDKPQIPTVPTNVSVFNNDAGYITMDSIPAIPTIPTNVSAFNNDAGYLTSFTESQILTISNDTIYLTGGSFVKLPTAEGFSGSYNDLTDKPTNVSVFNNDAGYITMDSIPAIPTIPTNVSAFTNDAGYLTSFTESQILTISNDTIYLTGGSFVKLPTAEGFSGSYNDLTDKPTNVSVFNNDAGYITMDSIPAIPTVPTNVSAFNNDAGYITMDSIPTIPTVPTNVSAFNNDAGYITKDSIPTNVSAFLNDAGYLTSFTESQILTISNDTIYLTGGSFVKLPAGFDGNYNNLTNKPALAPVATSGSWNDLTDKPTLFSGSWNNLTDKPVIPTVPTNVSTFNNDAGYLTTDSLNNLQNALNNIMNNIPSVNNGTLTIQQNGSTVGTFTANQSSAQTVNITTLTTDNVQAMINSSLGAMQQQMQQMQQKIDSLQQVIEDGQQVSGGLPVVTITDVWQGDLVNYPTVYGSITSNGITNNRPNEFILAKGFVFSASNQNPTLQNSSFVTVDTNSSDFFSTLNIYTNTTYYVRAFATNINGTNYSTPVTVRRGDYYAIPPTGSKNLLVSSASDTIYIYTYGGPDRNYGKNFNGSLTLYPSSSSKAVRIVSATYNTESNYDYLTVYSGSSTSGSSLVHVSGSGSLSEIYPNNGDQDLTVKFTSDPSVFNSGVLLKVVLTDFCPSSVTDATANINYSTVRVKEQCWMKENLRAGNLTSGATIGILTDYATGSTTVPYRRYPNGDQSNTSTYSYLYNWPAVANNSSTVSDGMSGLCPSGWHIPTRQDVMTFANNTTASFRTSTSGFNAKMAGRATYTNTTSFYDFGSYAYFWMTYSNTISSFYISSSGAIQSNFTSGEGRAHYKSLRCLKD